MPCYHPQLPADLPSASKPRDFHSGRLGILHVYTCLLCCAHTRESKEGTPEKCNQQLGQRFCEDCGAAELLQTENYFRADCEVLYAAGTLLWFETSTHSKLLTFRMWFNTRGIVRATFSIGFTAVRSIHEWILQLFLKIKTKVISSYSYFLCFLPCLPSLWCLSLHLQHPLLHFFSFPYLFFILCSFLSLILSSLTVLFSSLKEAEVATR